jgi:16S rRNA (uracil1498-N3)-methyltransferase
MNCILISDDDYVSGNQSRIRLSDRRADHIRSVLKSKPGAQLIVGMINGKLGSATVTVITEEYVMADIQLDRDPPRPLPVTLIVALPRPKSMRKVIHTATVMGVKNMYLIESWRVDKSYWSTPWLADDYLKGLMILGLEQAVDSVLPVIHIKKRFKPFVEDEIVEIIKDTKAFVAHPKALASCPRSVDYPVTLAIGPEGGFIPFEIELLEKHGFTSVSIGERILRVEEAVPAILGRMF